MRQDPDVNFHTLGRRHSAVVRITAELHNLLNKNGHDWLLWQSINKYVMAVFGESLQSFSITTANNRVFRFIFVPANADVKFPALQVTEVVSDTSDRLMWHIPIGSSSGLTFDMQEHLYSIAPADGAVIRSLFLDGSADRKQVVKILAKPAGAALQAAY